MATTRTTGYCPVCDGRYTVTAAGEIRAHGPPARRCPGSGADPKPMILIQGGAQ